SCKTESKKVIDTPDQSLTLLESPIFSEDSAFAFIEKQVLFGPRVPNTSEHQACKAWLMSKLASYADTVIAQNADLKAFDAKILKATNIIASFNPEASKRILLCAHWDTRPFADQDQEGIQEPILGANDGASGVGVLIEIARQLKNQPIDLGVDLILFDAEDYGQPAFSEEDYFPNSYCLGSQYWAANPHVPNYTAEYGILLDMVGGPNAVFTMEGTSVYFANNILHKVWAIAHALNYSSYFSYVQTPAITDDHLYINQIAKIPTIDIIQYDKTTESGFAWYWHTHKDNLDAIDKKTLKTVGQTLMQCLVQENASK
ncbi:MAG: M28 family peptidase, partial [Bacteroidetes bacterium]|nr:M28 family peptidase [Bacteroidota bacterium]